MPDIKIHSLDGTAFDAHLALPKGDHGPGLIVIKGLFNQKEAIEKICASYAQQGFVVVCPDLFHRQDLGPSVDENNEPDFERATKLYNSFDIEAGLRDLLATLAYIRKMPECGGKVGAVGYCLGCRMAYLMAARSDIDCTIGFYGIGIDTLLDEVYDIRTPLLLHFGENDKLLQPTARQRILKALAKNEVITAHTYEAAEHGFMRENSPTYNSKQADVANTRSRDFLEAHLKD